VRPLAGERLLPRAFDGVGTRELAGQRRVQVHDAAREPAEEAHRQDAHPSGEHHDIGSEAGHHIGEAGVVVGAVLAWLAPDVHGGHAG
jgi:hypothetical protein